MAYDRLRWDFIERMMVSMGFQSLWVQRIMAYVNSIRYCILQNGSEFNLISPSHGIRQGDPLSHFLFIIYAESFSALLQQKVDLGLIKGCTIT